MKRTRKSVVQEGLPHPCGATWDGKGTNFALFSANATKVELCLFDERGERELERIALPRSDTRENPSPNRFFRECLSRDRLCDQNRKARGHAYRAIICR
ncbi:MAG: hypothetical protein WB586_16650 [Chthoniobacterales bacterium]